MSFYGFRRMWTDARATTMLTITVAAYCAWIGALLAFDTHPTVASGTTDRLLPLASWGYLFLAGAGAQVISAFFSPASRLRIALHGYTTVVVVAWALVTDVMYPTVIGQPGYTLAALICGISPFVTEFIDRRYGLKPSTIEQVAKLQAETHDPGDMMQQLKWEWDDQRQAWITVIGGDVIAAVQDRDEVRLNFSTAKARRGEVQ